MPIRGDGRLMMSRRRRMNAAASRPAIVLAARAKIATRPSYPPFRTGFDGTPSQGRPGTVRASGRNLTARTVRPRRLRSRRDDRRSGVAISEQDVSPPAELGEHAGSGLVDAEEVQRHPARWRPCVRGPAEPVLSPAVLDHNHVETIVSEDPIKPAVGEIQGCERCRSAPSHVHQRSSHSSSFDQRRRPEMFFTAMATALRWPTSTTSRLPRVMPV